MDSRPGWALSAWGTVVALTGAVIVFYSAVIPDHLPKGLLTGGLTILGGLLLRVEGAVRDSRG